MPDVTSDSRSHIAKTYSIRSPVQKAENGCTNMPMKPPSIIIPEQGKIVTVCKRPYVVTDVLASNLPSSPFALPTSIMVEREVDYCFRTSVTAVRPTKGPRSAVVGRLAKNLNVETAVLPIVRDLIRHVCTSLVSSSRTKQLPPNSIALRRAIETAH